MKRLWLCAVLTVVGCGPVTPPKPPQPPAPTPVCAGQSHSCWHQPPGSPWLYACPVYDASGAVVGVQNETDKAKCPLPPAAPAACVLAGEPTVVAPVQQNSLGTSVNAAMKALRPDCEVGGTCLLGDTTQQEWQRLVTAQLRAGGLCAGQHTPITDEIAVAVTAAEPWQGFHVFAGNDGSGPVPPGGARRTVRWSPEAYTGSWLPPGGSPPPVTPPTTLPPPPATDACGEPVPPALKRFAVHVGTRWIDATPQVYGCGYKGAGSNFCRDIGLGTMPNDPLIERCDCPAGSEDNSAKRMACEEKVIGAPGPPAKAVWRSDGAVEVNAQNHLQARCSECSWIEVCNVDLTRCTRVKL